MSTSSQPNSRPMSQPRRLRTPEVVGVGDLAFKNGVGYFFFFFAAAVVVGTFARRSFGVAEEASTRRRWSA